MTAKISPETLERFTTFGDLLKYLRRRTGLTQRELSIAFGYSTAQISRLELNQRLPDLATVSARLVPALELEHDPPAAARLLELAEAIRREDAPASGLPPYKGLRHFDEADADLFFGRQALAERLLARVQSTLQQPGGPRFLGIVGASGSGKSSIVRAGLIPAIRWNPAFADWTVLTLTPTARPLEALARSLSQADSAAADKAALRTELVEDARALHRFASRLNSAAVARLPQRAGKGQQGLLLFVDQLEELFTLCRDEDARQAFIANLMNAAAEAGGSTLVVVTLRADFYASCAPYEALREALAGRQEYIGPMTAAELRQAIEEPARRGGWQLEPGLVDVLLTDVRAQGLQGPEPGALPLLSHALLETWQRRRGRALTLSGYLASGGVRGAIAETADVVFHDELDERQQAIARGIFLRLSELAEEAGGGDTRRRVSFEELITRPEDEASGEERMSLAGHTGDVMAVAMSRDGQLLASAGQDMIVRLWDVATRSLLWEGIGHTKSIEGLDFSADGAWLASSADDQTVKIWETASGRLLHDLTGFASLVDSVSVSPDGRYLATASADGIRLWDTADLTGEAVRSIPGSLGSVTFSHDGTRLAAASGSLAKVWDARTGLELAALAGHGGWVFDLAFSPDGQRLVTTSMDQTARVWHLGPGQETLSLAGSGTRVAFSPDGTQLASDEAGGTARLWDASSGAALQVLPGHTDLIYGFAFSPDSRRLASASADETAKVWDVATGQLQLTLSGHTVGVRDVAFSPDGSQLATAGFDKTARVWDSSNSQPLKLLEGHAGLVLGVAFSPDGTRLATSSTDATAKIWDRDSWELVATLEGHTNSVTDIAYSPDGKWLATGSFDATANLWEAATGRLAASFSGHGAGIQSIAFSPDNQLLITGSLDNTAKIWDIATGQLVLTLPGRSDGVTGVALSQNDGGARLAVASGDGTVRVLLVRTSDLLDLARMRVTRSLRPEECRQFLHLPECPAPQR